jgi:hypothetical protein
MGPVMSDAQLQRLLDAIETQSYIEGAGWLAWAAMLIVVCGLLTAIWLELRSRRTMAYDEALGIIKRAILELSKRSRG